MIELQAEKAYAKNLHNAFLKKKKKKKIWKYTRESCLKILDTKAANDVNEGCIQ